MASLRANVTRLPQPLAGMIDRVAKDAAGDANASSIAQIAEAMAEDVTGPCQQIVANRYPFAKSDRDVPMADFAKLFAPGGVIDRFFSANLEPLVNRTGKTWVWRPNPNLTRKLSDTTLAAIPAGGRNPRRVLSDRRRLAERHFRGEAADAEQRRADGDARDQWRRRSSLNRARHSPRPTVQWPGAGAGEASIVMAPGHARPQIQTGADRRLGAVSACRRRFIDSERQCAQGQLRRLRPRSLLPVHLRRPSTTP